MEDENVQLKEDLAVFENLAQAKGPEGSLSINRLRVDADVTDQYRYRMLLAIKGGDKERSFDGSLQLVVSLQQGGKSVKMILPSAGLPDASNYKLNFKYFRRVEGTFKIPAGAQVKSVEVRLLQGGMLKASKTVAL